MLVINGIPELRLSSRDDKKIRITTVPNHFYARRIAARALCSTFTREPTDMNKAELIESVAAAADISKAAAGKALDAVIAATVKAVSKGDTVTLIGFGSFKSSKRAARMGKNPKTGEAIKIAATTVPKFSAGAGFKAAVAGKKAAKKK